jgi:hypothetical protein
MPLAGAAAEPFWNALRKFCAPAQKCEATDGSLSATHSVGQPHSLGCP